LIRLAVDNTDESVEVLTNSNFAEGFGDVKKASNWMLAGVWFAQWAEGFRMNRFTSVLLIILAAFGLAGITVTLHLINTPLKLKLR
jgi:hypothetical protein